MITGAIGSINLAKDIGKTLLAVRDFNEVAPVVAKLNDELLKAQDALFRHNTELLALQQKQFEITEELRKAKKSLAERGRYTLVEVSDRMFAYRVNIAPVSGDVSNPIPAQVLHHLCQPCFDKGIKAVLKMHTILGGATSLLECPICKEKIIFGETLNL